jgi:hypothetical protein
MYGPAGSLLFQGRKRFGMAKFPIHDMLSLLSKNFNSLQRYNINMGRRKCTQQYNQADCPTE